MQNVESKSRCRVIRAAIAWAIRETELSQGMIKPKDLLFSDLIEMLGGTCAASEITRSLEPAKSKPRIGRVKKLRGLPDGWATNILDAVPDHPVVEKAALILISNLGFRPSETSRVSLQVSGDNILVVIVGSKIKKDSGQIFRGAVFQQSPDWAPVIDLCSDSERFPFQSITAKRIERIIEKASMAVFGDPRKVTASCFRNGVAAAAKGCGWPPEQIASLLGHQSQRTQKFYGRASLAQKMAGWIEPTSVKCQISPRTRSDAVPYQTQLAQRERLKASPFTECQV